MGSSGSPDKQIKHSKKRENGTRLIHRICTKSITLNACLLYVPPMLGRLMNCRSAPNDAVNCCCAARETYLFSYLKWCSIRTRLSVGRDTVSCASSVPRSQKNLESHVGDNTAGRFLIQRRVRILTACKSITSTVVPQNFRHSGGINSDRHM